MWCITYTYAVYHNSHKASVYATDLWPAQVFWFRFKCSMGNAGIMTIIILSEFTYSALWFRRNFDETVQVLTRKFPISLTLINCQRCLKSENKEIFTNVSRFSNYFAKIVDVHAMRSPRHRCLLQASIDRERLWHRSYWILVILIATESDYKP